MVSELVESVAFGDPDLIRCPPEDQLAASAREIAEKRRHVRQMKKDLS